MRYELEISEQGVCDCCPHDTDYYTYDALQDAQERAEKREGYPLTWTERSWGDGTRYWSARSKSGFRTFEIEENHG